MLSARLKQNILQQGGVVLFNKDHILHNKGVIPEKECNTIINLFESRTDLHRVGSIGAGIDNTNEINSSKKIDTEIFLKFGDSNSSWIWNYVAICLEEYKNQYPSVNDLVNPWSIFPEYKIQRYKPKEGYFLLHCENGGPERNEEPVLRRFLAWMIYLNDVKDGGYTEFPDQKRKFQPRRGDVLIWPAYFTHPHRGITSKTETKYIVTGWCTFNN